MAASASARTDAPPAPTIGPDNSTIVRVNEVLEAFGKAWDVAETTRILLPASESPESHRLREVLDDVASLARTAVRLLRRECNPTMSARRALHDPAATAVTPSAALIAADDGAESTPPSSSGGDTSPRFVGRRFVSGPGRSSEAALVLRRFRAPLTVAPPSREDGTCCICLLGLGDSVLDAVGPSPVIRLPCCGQTAHASCARQCLSLRCIRKTWCGGSGAERYTDSAASSPPTTPLRIFDRAVPTAAESWAKTSRRLSGRYEFDQKRVEVCNVVRSDAPCVVEHSPPRCAGREPREDARARAAGKAPGCSPDALKSDEARQRRCAVRVGNRWIWMMGSRSDERIGRPTDHNKRPRSKPKPSHSSKSGDAAPQHISNHVPRKPAFAQSKRGRGTRSVARASRSNACTDTRTHTHPED